MIDIPKETLDFFGNDELRSRIFYEKYSLISKDSKDRLETTPPQTWRRIAKAIASVEKNEEVRKKTEEEFYWLMQDFRFVPGGRILFGAGADRKVTLLNCYYLPIKSDSIEGIFDTAKEMAKTYSYGGGVGIDISILRPENAPVHNAARVSTGAASFMELYSTITGTIGQSGRRGALMITMDVTHPDIDKFIISKSDKVKVRFANISVKVYDDFMRAVEEHRKFELHFKNDKVDIKKEIDASEIWDSILDSALNTGDPGIMFWDRIKKESPTEYDDRTKVMGTNPCSEQPLEDYGACDLGAINLAAFVSKPFTKEASVDWENLDKTVRYGVRFLDNVLDYSYPRHALKEQAEETIYARRIGLGIMGMATMFIELGLKYDTDEAIDFTDKMFKRIKEVAYDESSNLAKEKGSFPAFKPDKHLARDFVSRLDDSLKKKIKEQGLRNSCILTIAPTGSISSMAGVSGGIEPIFALSYTRRSESLSMENFEVLDPIVKAYMDKHNIKDKKDLPGIFVTAHKIDPFFRVKMQATVQKHIDSSISSTVNLPSSADKATVNKIYLEAWKLGCKSITVYKEGSKRDILKSNDEEESTDDKADGINKIVEEERPYILTGTTVKLSTQQGNLYVTINKNDKNEIKEVFLSMGKSGETEKSYAEAIGRLISLYLQSGGNAARVIKTLKGIKGGSSTWFNGIQLFSVPDAVAKSMELVMNKKDFNAPSSTLHAIINKDASIKSNTCPSCGQHTLIFENGCYICKSCGYTKCE